MSNSIAPLVAVQIEQPGTDDLLEYTVQTDNRDLVRFDMLRYRLAWPDLQSAPMLWMTVLAWSALERTKVIDTKVEDFIASCVTVAPVNEDGEEISLDEAAEGAYNPDPFQREATPA